MTDSPIPMAFFAETIIPGAGAESVVKMGNVWAPFQVEAFKVLARCMQAVAEGRKPPYRGAWVERCKGGSKDADIALALCWLLYFSPRYQLVELGADDFDQIKETWKAMQEILRLNPWLAKKLRVTTARIHNIDTGSECAFLTCDDTGSHGSRPTVTVCNELAHVQSETFMLTLMDNADKLANNLAIIATNAGELKTWQHRWRENYRTDPDWYFQKVSDPAPWISPRKLADAQRRNPSSRFQRLWQGVWTSPGGDALPPECIERAIVHDLPLPHRFPEEYTICGIGVDAGITTHHGAVVVLVGSHAKQKLRVAKVVDFAPPVRLEDLRDCVIRLGGQYQTNFVALDPWQMLRVAEELAACGFNVEAKHQTGPLLTWQAAAVLEAFREGVIELYRDDSESARLLIEDLFMARIVEKSYGHKLVWEENESGHSDRGAALAQVLPYALETLGAGPTVIVDDGLGDNLMRWINRQHRMQDQMEAWGMQ